MSLYSTSQNLLGLISGDVKQRAYIKWRLKRGDETLRLDYPLNDTSIVFDLGGYEGDFANEMVSRYGCHVHLFEPMPKFAEQCRRRFVSDVRVTCHDFALGSTACTFDLTDEANGSSRFASNQRSATIQVQCRRFADFFAEQKINAIDLLKINIEGGEYDVLPHLIDTDLIKRIKSLQIQFHDFVPNHQEMRSIIRERMAVTHRETWNFPYVWENWTIKQT